MGWLILLMIIGYPVYAYMQHNAGTAEPTTYILLGMCVMIWINIICAMLGLDGKRDE